MNLQLNPALSSTEFSTYSPAAILRKSCSFSCLFPVHFPCAFSFISQPNRSIPARILLDHRRRCGTNSDVRRKARLCAAPCGRRNCCPVFPAQFQLSSFSFPAQFSTESCSNLRRRCGTNSDVRRKARVRAAHCGEGAERTSTQMERERVFPNESPFKRRILDRIPAYEAGQMPAASTNAAACTSAALAAVPSALAFARMVRCTRQHRRARQKTHTKSLPRRGAPSTDADDLGERLHGEIRLAASQHAHGHEGAGRDPAQAFL